MSGNLAFGDVAAGSTATSVLTITNSGNALLTVTGMTAPNAGSGIYAANWTSGTVSPAGSQDVIVRFAPAAAISYNGTLTVSGDQTSGTNTIPISGAGAASSMVPLAGVVTASGGTRIGGATVTVLDGPNTGRTATTTNGDYRFDNLTVGNANLSANASGYSQTSNGVYINGANTLNFTLLVRPSPPRERVGATCNDGTSSSATGSGACSSHGGVRCWRYSDGTCTLP